MGLDKDISEAFDNLHENYNLATVSQYYKFLNRFPDNVLFENAELILSEPSRGTDFMLGVVSRVYPDANELASHLECATEIAEEYTKAGNDAMVESLENYKDDIIFMCVSKEHTMESLMDDITIASIPNIPDNITAKFIKPILEAAKYEDEEASQGVHDFYSPEHLSKAHPGILVGGFPKILMAVRKVLIAKLFELKKKRLQWLNSPRQAGDNFISGDTLYEITRIPKSFCKLIVESGETNAERLNQLIAVLNEEIRLFSEDITTKISFKNDETGEMETPCTLGDYIGCLMEAKQMLVVYKENKKDIINDNVMAMQPQVGFPEEDGISESAVTLEQVCSLLDYGYEASYILEAKNTLNIDEKKIETEIEKKVEKDLKVLVKKIETCKDEETAMDLLKNAGVLIVVNFITTPILTLTAVMLLIAALLKMIKRVATSLEKFVNALRKQISSAKTETDDQKKRKAKVEKAIAKRNKNVTEVFDTTEEEFYEISDNFKNEDELPEVLSESSFVVTESQLVEAELEADRAVIEFATYDNNSLSDDKLVELFENLLRTSAHLDSIRESYEVTMEGKLVTKASMGIQKGVRKIQHKVKNDSIQGSRATAAIGKAAKSVEDQINNTIDKIKAADNSERREKLIKGGLRVKIKRLIRVGIVTGAAGAIGNWWYALVALVGQLLIDKGIDEMTKRELVDDIEDNMKLLDEKIEDAKSDSNKEAKYKLMRQKNALEKERNRLRYNLRDTRTRNTDVVRQQQ